MTCVSWNDAKAYLDWLNKQSDEKRPTGWVYRLPREAEREYSCRGGAASYTTFHFGDVLDDSDRQANFDGNYPYGSTSKSKYRERSREVGAYKANGFGLYDMHGNVWEWCSDRYGADYYGKAEARGPDPAGPSEGSFRVIRGGGWDNYGQYGRSAYRAGFVPTNRSHSLGFRVALVPSSRGTME